MERERKPEYRNQSGRNERKDILGEWKERMKNKAERGKPRREQQKRGNKRRGNQKRGKELERREQEGGERQVEVEGDVEGGRDVEAEEKAEAEVGEGGGEVKVEGEPEPEPEEALPKQIEAASRRKEAYRTISR